jgi:ATP-dependent exoDNAse (exonuclease V) beta subunit
MLRWRSEVYDTERQLLYVACTRARYFLMVSGVAPVSEFLEGFEGGCEHESELKGRRR